MGGHLLVSHLYAYIVARFGIFCGRTLISPYYKLLAFCYMMIEPDGQVPYVMPKCSHNLSIEAHGTDQVLKWTCPIRAWNLPHVRP